LALNVFGEKNMDRRKFLTWVGVGTLAHSLPMILAACNSTSEDAPQATSESPQPEIDTSVRRDGFQAVGTLEQLDQEGVILNRSSAAEPVLVIRNAENTLVAFNPTCTHQQCTVEFQAAGKILTCPCHGSQFSPDGTVVKGPATRPLATFDVKEEESLVLVKVG
jgi:cytochrome b6-f complex iron-sulfur subunit